MSYELLADELLVKLLQCSDAHAFEAIYDRHWLRAYQIAFSKLRNEEAAEDITQHVFVSLWERRQHSEIKCLEAYITTAVKYKCISYYESKYAQTTLVDIENAIIQADVSTEEWLSYEELRHAVYRAMELLPPKTREVFQLSRFHSHSIREIAQRLNISEKAVEYHVTQSLKVMRRELREYLNPTTSTALMLGSWLLI